MSRRTFSAEFKAKVWTSPGFVDTSQVVAEARSNASGLTSPM